MNKTTLNDINDVMKMLTTEHGALSDSYKTFQTKFADIFGFKPDQNVTAYQVVRIIHAYLHGNGGAGDTNPN